MKCMHHWVARTVIIYVENSQVARETLCEPNSVEEWLTDCAAQRGDLGTADTRRGVVDPRSRKPAT
jgi:hypothetical protein